MSDLRPMRILLHHPGVQQEWRRVAAAYWDLIEDAAATLDSPTSLVAVRLKGGVLVEQAEELAERFRAVVDEQGTVEVELGGQRRD